MEKAADQFGIDEKFLSGVYRIAIFAAIVISCVLLFYKIHIALSFAFGCVISLSLLWSLEFVVRRTLVPGEKRLKLSLVLLTISKYLGIGACFYFFLVRTKWLNAPALAAGLGIVYAVITLKAFRIVLFKR